METKGQVVIPGPAQKLKFLAPGIAFDKDYMLVASGPDRLGDP